MTPCPTFIGIDFAWQSERNPTGIAVARKDEVGGVVVEVFPGVYGLDAITEIVKRNATANTVVAVDAPLIIRNRVGRRPCESEISRRFSTRHASAHSSNLSLYPDP